MSIDDIINGRTRKAWAEAIASDGVPLFVGDYQNPPGWIGRRPDKVRIEAVDNRPYGGMLWHQIVVYRWWPGAQRWQERYRIGSPISSNTLRRQWVLWSENRRGHRHSR